MTRRVVHLVERRTREVRLPPEDVAFLVANASHILDVLPMLRRSCFRITPREFVGQFDSPNRRFHIAPKIPWPNVRMLLGLPSEHAGEHAERQAGLLEVFAREFVAQLREVTRIGLVPGYGERNTESAFLRGKLRAADQLRDAAARAFPDRFQITETVLDFDTQWNRIVRATADGLLGFPNLSPNLRAESQDAAAPLAEVSRSSVTDADFATAEAEPRVSHYGPLLQLCRTLHDGLTSGQLTESGTGAFLLNLGHVFEQYLSRGLSAELAKRPGWSLEAHPAFPVGPTVLQPDMFLRRRGKPRVVLDAKWKAGSGIANADDLHQVLAYSAITGAKHVGLVYPGCRFARRTFAVPGADIRLSLLRVQVVGTVAECSNSLAKLARFVRSRRL